MVKKSLPVGAPVGAVDVLNVGRTRAMTRPAGPDRGKNGGVQRESSPAGRAGAQWFPSTFRDLGSGG
jgi:hypothetical protein